MLLIEFDNKAAVRDMLNPSPRLARSRLFGNIFARKDLPISQRQQAGRNIHALRIAAQVQDLGPKADQGRQ